MDPKRTNLHTHTTFCDGRNTPAELADAAFSSGFFSLGFSAHAYTPCDESYCMKKENEVAYRQAVLREKERYAGRMDIFLGLEQDAYSALSSDGYDFCIGSVHYISPASGIFCSVDHTAAIQQQGIDRYFGGDYYAYCAAYFRTVASLAGRKDLPIVGHFDLVSKFNEGDCLFSTADTRYRKAALEALDAFAGTEQIFEINTGAISRGKRVTPYPAPFLLQAIHDMRGRILLSSDCHDSRYLTCAYDQAAELARSCGFSSAWVLTKNGFCEAAL